MTSLSITSETMPADGLRAAAAAMMATMLAAVAAWRARAAQRHALAELDARMLRDIGLGPAERRSEIAKPFWRG